MFIPEGLSNVITNSIGRRRCFAALCMTLPGKMPPQKVSCTPPRQRRARSRPLNADERQQWRRFKAKIGRQPV